jgi:hypothetical protein
MERMSKLSSRKELQQSSRRTRNNRKLSMKSASSTEARRLSGAATIAHQKLPRGNSGIYTKDASTIVVGNNVLNVSYIDLFWIRAISEAAGHFELYVPLFVALLENVGDKGAQTKSI